MKVGAPWTAEQVAALNVWQHSGRFHPFTCVNRRGHLGEGVLVATSSGWVCPECAYTQEWAHDFMLEATP